ncbi:MAG: hypothetical protein ABSH11_02585 [Verrucomicrobiota bacterium]
MNIPNSNQENGAVAGRRLPGFLLVLAGIVLGQAVLYGPSLTGNKILLPLDILAQAGVYIPQTAETAGLAPHNMALSDLVYQFEPARQFAVSEIHQGRFPWWAPYQYGGVPFIWPKFSPFLLLECLAKSPVILAWIQVLAALVTGTGMYFFCRKVLSVGFWPATVCAWCYPLTAFFALWQGFPTGLAVYWLPWLFLAVDRTIHGTHPLAAPGLSVVTFLTLISGHIDVAGQVLLGSGIYAIWCWGSAHRGKWWDRKSRIAMARVLLGWGLGFLLATPHLLPLLEYAQTGSRMISRNAGVEERPPTGLQALPQVVLPDLYGTTEKNSAFIAPAPEKNLLESASAAYTGVLATLLVAPLAWSHRRLRAGNLFWLFLALFGLSWCLNLPGFVPLLRLPVLHLMSHNRLVFLTSFAILALTANGLETLLSGPVQRRWWFWLPAVLLAALSGWCLYRSVVLPAAISTQAALDAFYLKKWGNILAAGDVHQVQAWFIRHYTIMAEFCIVGVIGWLGLWFQKPGRFRLFPVLVFLLVVDLLRFDYGRSAQCDPALYYPEIPALKEITRSLPGRIIGGFPAPLGFMQGLNDIRGYDSIDPARMVDVLKTTAAMPSTNLAYAETFLLVPKGNLLPPSGIELPPILDLLNVRYVILRGAPPQFMHPPFQSDDYWVLVNSNALPRAFVPRTVKTVDVGQELEELTSPKFNPVDVALVTSPVELPARCRGTVQITNEIPTRIRISAQMETPGLIVLADNWDKGWRAFWNGRPTPVLRVDYTIRGVVVPAGTGTLEFNYQPASVVLGLWLAGLAAISLLGWVAIIRLRSRQKQPPNKPPPAKVGSRCDRENPGRIELKPDESVGAVVDKLAYKELDLDDENFGL